MRRSSAAAPTCYCRSARRPGRTCWSGGCLPSNCSARHRSLRTIPIIAKDRRMRGAAFALFIVPLLAASQARVGRGGGGVCRVRGGLVPRGRGPPLLVLADRGGTDELVEVRLLLDSTLPVIRSRTSHLSAQLADGRHLQQAAFASRAELSRSRDELVARRQRFAALEQEALQQALASGGQALTASDVAIAAGENVERLRGKQSSSQAIRAGAGRLASEDPAPSRPLA